jgi:hypothetical protein
MQNLLFFFVVFNFSCKNNLSNAEFPLKVKTNLPTGITQKQITDSTSWEYFLQHLPEKKGPIVNYQGKTVDNQDKHFSLINYDIGTRDLQQCADALMRLRAEYLFKQNRFDEIGFHFTSGYFCSFADYCRGKKPVPKGREVIFISSSSHPQNAQSLRNYLDIVYTYAGTISLANELKNTNSFGIGTVVITPGSPGHCFIITNEATNDSGEKLYKLVEGYTPAQSIYVLQNIADPSLDYWHLLKKGPIETASYQFSSYKLKNFE